MIELASGASLPVPYLPSFYLYLTLIITSLSMASWLTTIKGQFLRLQQNLTPVQLSSQRSSGFTLIEIMLVLAIAGLIMVIVFLAVQGAQRSNRDRARQDMVNRAVASLNSYAGNNNGAYPTAAGTFAVGSTTWFTAATGLNQTIPGLLSSTTQALTATAVTAVPAINVLTLYIGGTTPTGMTCGGNITAGGGAVMSRMEATGQGYCVTY